MGNGPSTPLLGASPGHQDLGFLGEKEAKNQHFKEEAFQANSSPLNVVQFQKFSSWPHC